MKRISPLGIKLLSYLYLLNAALYVLSSVLFYKHILIFGREINRNFELIVRSVFIIIPLYLFFRLKRLKKDAWFLALGFHLYFLINNIAGILQYSGYTQSLFLTLRLHGLMFNSPLELFVFIFSTVANLFLFIYLFERKAYFLFED